MCVTRKFALDAGKAMNSILWIKEMSSNKKCLESLANNNPDVIPHKIIV